MLRIPGDIFVHYIDDYVYLQKQGIKAIYEPDPILFLKRLKSYLTIYSTRLHGAIAGFSNMATVYIENDNNYRIEQAIKPFYPILAVVDICIISQFKEITKKAYIDILKKS